MHALLDLTLNGIANGAIYAAVALSLVLIWRATRILNFAQAGMSDVHDVHRAGRRSTTGRPTGSASRSRCSSGLVLGALVERVIIRPVEGARR